MQEAALQLLKYKVDKIEFNLNENYKIIQGTSIELNQNLERIISKIDENTLQVTLKYDIYNLENKQVPFTMSIIISSVFSLLNWEQENNKEIAMVNTVAILFPFMRSLIATITANANVPPYILPVLNVAAWLNNLEKNK